MMDWMFWTLPGVSALYVLLVFFFTIGWMRLKPLAVGEARDVSLSVVLAARNEARNILPCLEAIARQNFPVEQLEVIVVDDHSEDNTWNLVAEFIRDNNLEHFRLLRQSDFGGPGGKKHALATAIARANGEYVITTDADCTPPSRWLQTIASYILAETPLMLIGPVRFGPLCNVFDSFQALEFCSLTGTAAGAAAFGHPIMCNGANLAFSRKAFNETGGYSHNLNYSSGDDMFLLQQFHRSGDGKILYVKHQDALVTTPPVNGWRQFLRQRVRWASKTPGYTDPVTIAVAVLVALFNFLLIAGLPLAILAPGAWVTAWLASWLLKIIADFPLLWMVTGFFSQRHLMRFFPLVALLYPLYVVLTAALSLGRGSRIRW
jgi:poly-beta-1,6-N-acetyl-D-glucosamine synthase